MELVSDYLDQTPKAFDVQPNWAGGRPFQCFEKRIQALRVPNPFYVL
jgi:hypothetical protein